MIRNRKACLFLVTIVMFSVFAQTALADGMIYYPHPNYPYWQLQSEDQQLAAINYEDGFENLMMTVDVSDFQSLEGVWLFPVPSDPDDIVIDIVSGFPQLHGYDVEQRMDTSISNAFETMRLSQIYTFPLYFMRGYGAVAMFGGGALEEQKAAATDYGVTVHEHIEEMGLTTELITAEDGDGFYAYLTDKNLSLPVEAKDILDDYIGDDYTFVVSWISDTNQYKTEVGQNYGYRGIASTLGVMVTFPTDKMYMPLKPTSVYGSEEIPIKVYVMGHVTPELYTKIAKSTQVNYYYQEQYYVPEEQSAFFNNVDRIEKLEYTVIDLKVPSKYLKDDLWIDNSSPFNIKLASFINNQIWIWGVIMFIICSGLASMLSGIIIFRGSQPDKKKFALFGLANLLSIIGFAITAYLIKVDEKYSKFRLKAKEEKSIRDAVKLSAIISAIVGLFIAFSTMGYGSFETKLIYFAIIFSPLFLFLTATLWAYQHNKKLIQYIASFSILFLVITYLFEKLMIFVL